MRVALLSTVVAACGAVLPVSAQALTVSYQLNVPREQLDAALKDLAKQTGLQIARFSDTAGGSAVVGPVDGQMTADQALTSFLASSGLTYKRVNETTIAVMTIAEASKLAAATTLAQVQGSGAPAQGAASKEGKTNSSDGFRAAQADQGGSASTPGVEHATAKASDGLALQEIVVTAQKRVELLSKTPMAVTALDMDQLQQANVVDVKDLTSTVPNLQTHTIGQGGYVGITIRGISNLDYSGTANPAVSTYIDGTYIGLSQGFANELYDLERVEVLRGPQGTLYGRNATGGNVNILTADPKSAFGASADVSYGNYHDVQTHGMVNMPVSDQLQIRAAFMTHRNDGYFNTEGTTAQNYGAADDFGARVTALWTPISQFRWRLSFDYSIEEGTPWASIQTAEDGRPANGGSPYHQPASEDPEPENYIRNAAVRSRMDWAPSEAIDVAYIAGYQSLDQHYYWATTGQPGAPANTAFKEFVQYSASFQSQEIDVNYDSRRLKNVFGGSYFGRILTNGAQAGIFAIQDFDFVSPYSDAKSHNDAWGVFDQATYRLTDRVRVTGGVRYSRETQFVAQINYVLCPVLPDVTLRSLHAMTTFPASCGPYSTPSGSGSWSKTTWKAGGEFDISDQTLAYVSVATGFKSGGVQPEIPPPLPTTFQPETVTNYELGLKTRLLNGALNFRTALFDEEYTDQQVFQLVSVPILGLVLVTTNAAKARIYGAELESEWRLTNADEIQWFADYLHATYTQFDNAYDSRTGTTVPSLSGNQLPNAPQESVRLQYSHKFTLGNGGTLTPLAAIYWQSTSYLQPFNESYYRQEAYSKTNLSLTYSDASAQWKVTAYGDNLENHAVRTSNYSSNGNVYSDFASPRTYGVRVSYQY